MNHPPSGIITIATDFGTRDNYVGTMKGVIYRIHPKATVVDLTHQVQPQDLMEASLVLESSYRYFPEGTVHLVVVDPGVGTRRRPIVIDTPSHLFVGPDNGVFSRIYAAQSQVEVLEIRNPSLMLPQISDTFHGRDIFAPVAAHLCRGIYPGEVGPVVDDPVRRDPPQPSVWQDQITGEVIHIDSFGNILTNITREVFEMVAAGKRFRVIVNGKAIDRISRSYEEVERGKALAIFSSLELLEIAVHGGRADRRIGAGKGDPVQVLTENP
ncbi:MAG: S-adenosyl-l-methionine hydroxide adenosyltransferase family protein [Candidatus Eisenbacteria bacterium]|nr:SAM-dependent chlorinase/fluorinase [Candidatus Eisenbacteria bacterium]